MLSRFTAARAHGGTEQHESSADAEAGASRRRWPARPRRRPRARLAAGEPEPRIREPFIRDATRSARRTTQLGLLVVRSGRHRAHPRATGTWVGNRPDPAGLSEHSLDRLRMRGRGHEIVRGETVQGQSRGNIELDARGHDDRAVGRHGEQLGVCAGRPRRPYAVADLQSGDSFAKRLDDSRGFSRPG